MNPKTLEALKDSIEHWKRMVAGGTEDRPRAQECALCILFTSNFRCYGCPVAQAGHIYCKDSPFDEASYAFRLIKSKPQAFREAAQKELEFLESLLPEE